MSNPTLQLVRSEVPNRGSYKSSNAWTTFCPPELCAILKRNPGVTFQLADQDGNPLEIPTKTFTAMAGAAPRPYRLQSRTAGDSKARRLVWVSMDPGHWERRDQAEREKRAAQ